AGDDDDGVLHRAVLLERRHELRDRGFLLPDRDVDSDEVLALLIDDRVDRDRALPRLAVADDQLALAAADREHLVDRLDPRRARRVHVLPLDDARRDDVHAHVLRGLDRALAVERPPERIDDAADEALTRGRLDDATGRADLVAFLDVVVLAEDDRRDGVLFEVEREPERLVPEVEELRRLAARETVDPRDAVADLDDRPDVDGLGLGLEPLDLRLQDVGDL